MGLDMFLNGSRFLWSFDENADTEIKDAVQKLLPELGDKPEGPGCKGFEVKTIGAELGYWRKANQIHKWFVDNVQDGDDDCGNYRVEWEQLVKLRDLCKKVLANKELAEELLPAQSGFFFGTTGYDEWYYQDLERTVQIIDRIDTQLVTKTLDNGTRYSNWEFEYHSSW
jgi:hypothetical protein